MQIKNHSPFQYNSMAMHNQHQNLVPQQRFQSFQQQYQPQQSVQYRQASIPQRKQISHTSPTQPKQMNQIERNLTPNTCYSAISYRPLLDPSEASIAQSFLIDAKGQKIETPERSMPKVLRNISSPGLPDTNFNLSSTKNRSQPNTTNSQPNSINFTLNSFGSKQSYNQMIKQETITKAFASQDNFIKPMLTQAQKQALVSSFSNRDFNKRGNSEEDTSKNIVISREASENVKNVKSMINEAVQNMFKKKQQLDTDEYTASTINYNLITMQPSEMQLKVNDREIFEQSPPKSVRQTQSPATQSSIAVVHDNKYYVQPLHEDVSAEEEQDSKSFVLHSFNPQQFHKLISEEKGIQTSNRRDDSLIIPEPESQVPYMHHQDTLKSITKHQLSSLKLKKGILRSNKSTNKSKSIQKPSSSQDEIQTNELKFSVVVSQQDQTKNETQEQFVFQGSSENKHKFINDLKNLFNQYSKDTTHSNLKQVSQQYIKMSNLEESVYSQKQSLRPSERPSDKNQFYSPPMKNEDNPSESTTSLLSTTTRYKPCTQDIQQLLKQINYPPSYKGQNKSAISGKSSRSPFLKKRNDIIPRSDISEFKLSIKNTRASSYKAKLLTKHRSTNDERTFKF